MVKERSRRTTGSRCRRMVKSSVSELEGVVEASELEAVVEEEEASAPDDELEAEGDSEEASLSAEEEPLAVAETDDWLALADPEDDADSVTVVCGAVSAPLDCIWASTCSAIDGFKPFSRNHINCC